MNTYIAKCPFGLEETLAGELAALKATDIQLLNRAVSFRGDKELIYRANYACRTALRILQPIQQFNIASEDDLYRSISRIAWEDYLGLDQTFAIDATVGSSIFTHSQYAGLRTKDAIADRFRGRYGRRPSVNVADPHLRINIHMYNNRVDVSFDTSGDSLHKRGYHVANAEAPMSEVLAAGMILLTGWRGESNFVDPMCGSGTLLTEAALIAMNIPAGQYRTKWGFMQWPDFDRALWEQIKHEELKKQRFPEIEIAGGDISRRNLQAAEANLKQARLHKDIELRHTPFQQFDPPEAPGIMVTNPPYGERVKTEDIVQLYRDLGDVLKQRYKGYRAFVISSDLRALKMVGLKPYVKHTLFNGQLECRYAGFELYEGTRRYGTSL